MDDSAKLHKGNEKDMKEELLEEDDVDIESEEMESDENDGENGDVDGDTNPADDGKPRKKRKTKESEGDIDSGSSSSASASSSSNSASSDGTLLMPKLDPFPVQTQHMSSPSQQPVSANSPGFYPYSAAGAHPHALIPGMAMPAVIPSLESNVSGNVATAGIPLSVTQGHQSSSTHSAHHHHHPPGTISISSAISNAAKDEPRALSTLEQLAQAEKLGIDLGDDDEEEENTAGNGAPKRSHKGTSCHQCKNTKSLKKLAFCANLFNKRTKPEKRICRKKYCDQCLQKFYNDKLSEIVTRPWICASCRGVCCCAACTRNLTKKKQTMQRRNGGARAAAAAANAADGQYDDGQGSGKRPVPIPAHIPTAHMLAALPLGYMNAGLPINPLALQHAQHLYDPYSLAALHSSHPNAQAVAAAAGGGGGHMPYAAIPNSAAMGHPFGLNALYSSANLFQPAAASMYAPHMLASNLYANPSASSGVPNSDAANAQLAVNAAQNAMINPDVINAQIGGVGVGGGNMTADMVFNAAQAAMMAPGMNSLELKKSMEGKLVQNAVAMQQQMGMLSNSGGSGSDDSTKKRMKNAAVCLSELL